MKRWYRRPLPVLSASAALLCTGLFTTCYIHDAKLETIYRKINAGMPEQSVIRILGKPDSVGRCGHLGGFPANCSREYLYKARLPTITTWAVFINDHGTVIATYRYVSP